MSDKFELDIKLNTSKRVTPDDKQPLMNKSADNMNNSN
jgi:hypothetical protein